MIDYHKVIEEFDWKDLNTKIMRIAVAEPNPECLEFIGQVWAMDLGTAEIYLIHEWDSRELNDGSKFPK